MKQHLHKFVTAALFLGCFGFVYQLEKEIKDLEDRTISTHFTEQWFENEMAKSETRDDLIEVLRLRLDAIEKKIKEIH